MPQIDRALSTGLVGLDRVLSGLIPGDNIVWQVAGPKDYEPFVQPYCENALARTKRLTYFRFADHGPLVQPGPGVETCELDPRAGFEVFVSQVHDRIASNGDAGYYLLDIRASSSHEEGGRARVVHQHDEIHRGQRARRRRGPRALGHGLRATGARGPARPKL